VRFACGQETIQFSAKANALAGDVYCCDAVGVDRKLIDAGQPVSDVAVSECDATFENCVELGKSDQEGKFRFVSTKTGRTHYLKLNRLGFNQDRVVVRLSRKSKTLHLRLRIAT